MDQDVIKWILDQRFNLEGEDRQKFLAELKARPERVKMFIENELLEWTAVAAFTLRKTIAVGSFDRVSDELLKAVKEHFASELEALPA